MGGGCRAHGAKGRAGPARSTGRLRARTDIADHTPREADVKKLVILIVLAGIGFAIFKMMSIETQPR
jgi:hypothetical protein